MPKTIDDLIIQIRQEEQEKVILEMQQLAEKEELPRKQVMDHIKGRMIDLGMKPNYQHYQVISAFSAIIRHVLLVNRLDRLNHDQVDLAISIADELLDIVSVTREERSQP